MTTSLGYLAGKYQAYYSGKEGRTCLLNMIEQANRIGENACSLFEEHANPFHDSSITADDLERLFEGSIRSLIEAHLKGFPYRHILKFRAALSRDCDANISPPTVVVQYFLVWVKKKKSLSTLNI